MKKYLVWLLLCVSSSIVHADEEDWYTYWAVGTVNYDYPGSLGSELDFIEALPGVDRTRTSYDLFGFYWPQAENSLLGFVVSGSTDFFETWYDELRISQNLFAVSGMRFFGREIGDGFFIRGDAGLAQITFENNVSRSTSDSGFGYLLGVGYAFPVSTESRILVGVSFSDKLVEGDSWKSTSFTVGGLW